MSKVPASNLNKEKMSGISAKKAQTSNQSKASTSSNNNNNKKPTVTSNTLPNVASSIQNKDDKTNNSNQSQASAVPEVYKPKEVNLKQIVVTIFDKTDEELNRSGKWPIVIDENERVSAFLRHRDVRYVNCLDKQNLQPETLRIAILSAIRYGKPLVIELESENLFELLKEACDRIEIGLFDCLCNKTIIENERYFSLVRPTDGKEYEKYNFVFLDNFIVVLLISKSVSSETIKNLFFPYSVTI